MMQCFFYNSKLRYFAVRMLGIFTRDQSIVEIQAIMNATSQHDARLRSNLPYLLPLHALSHLGNKQ